MLKSGANKGVQCAKTEDGKLENLSFVLPSTWWKERTDFHRVSSDHHMCLMLCAYLFFIKGYHLSL